MKPSTYQLCDLRDYACQARAGGLRYVSDGKPGITRKRHGRHFLFYDPKGNRILDEAEILRIRRLAIPPAYREVWICPHANGHIQATGLDARGRKQYRYHADWRMVRDATKFNHMLAFGEALPLIRSAVASDMARRGLSREKVLATVVALLEKTLIRVGNEDYARKNQSYGLTTLRDEHVEITGSTLRFRFKGKSNKEWNLKLTDRRIASIVRACADIDGYELFKWVDEFGGVHDVSSGDVNAYLQEITGEAFTAKDFRTWTGTVLAAMALHDYAAFDSQAQAKERGGRDRARVEAPRQYAVRLPQVLRPPRDHRRLYGRQPGRPDPGRNRRKPSEPRSARGGSARADLPQGTAGQGVKQRF